MNIQGVSGSSSGSFPHVKGKNQVRAEQNEAVEQEEQKIEEEQLLQEGTSRISEEMQKVANPHWIQHLVAASVAGVLAAQRLLRKEKESEKK